MNDEMKNGGKMVILQSKTWKVKVAKVIAILISLLLAIVFVLGIIDESRLYMNLKWMRLPYYICEIILNVVLVLIIIVEKKTLLLVSLILLGVILIPKVLLFNVLLVYTAADKIGQIAYHSVEEAKWGFVIFTVSVETVVVVFFALLVIRLYCVFQLYQWVKLPRVTATVTTQVQASEITVQGGALP